MWIDAIPLARGFRFITRLGASARESRDEPALVPSISMVITND
jgi:hypothetical protein